MYPPQQPQHPTTAHAATSVTIIAINSSHPTKQRMDISIIPLLFRVQPLPTAYGTNNVTNNTAELLARILAYELLPHDTPAIIIYESTVVHSQHLAIFDTSYTNRQRTRTIFPTIIRILAQCIETTNVRANPPSPPLNDEHSSLANATPTLMNSVIAQIRKVAPCWKTWIPSKHLTLANNIVYIKIKSHQFRSNEHPKYHTSPQPCLALVHKHHWSDKHVSSPTPIHNKIRSHYAVPTPVSSHYCTFFP